MKQAAQFLLAALLLGLSVSAQAASTPAAQSSHDPIRILSLNNGSFRFALGNVSRLLNLSGSISGCTGTMYDSSTGQKLGGSVAARVLDEVRQRGAWYVLMQVDTESNCNVQGMCGAATSTDLIWLKLDSGLRAEARQTQAVDDCVSNTVLDKYVGKPGQDGSPAQLETKNGSLNFESKLDDYTKNVTTIIRVSYDHNAAQKGLVVSESQQALK